MPESTEINMKFDGLCRKKEYEVTLQKADVNKVYNIADKPGYVYNFLEDAEISVEGMEYVVTGLLGEMWPIPESRVSTYEIIRSVSEDTFLAKTKPAVTIYEYRRVPAKEQTVISIENGSELHVNSPKCEHGEGDVLIRVKGEKHFWVVNGLVFEKTYEVCDLD